MATMYAQLNLKLKDLPDIEVHVEKWQKELNNAALEGYADEFEVFYNVKLHILGVSIPFDDEDPMTLLEAGAVLGYCNGQYEAISAAEDDGSGFHPVEASWFSINDVNDNVLDAPIDQDA